MQSPEITLDSKAFARALETAATVIPRRSVTAVLECARLQTQAGTLVLTASDLDREIDVPVATDKADGWSPDCCIGRPAAMAKVLRRAGDITRLSPGEADREMRIHSGRLTIDASVMPAADFPTVRRYVEEPAWSATISEEFLGALRRLQPYVSTEETRYYLNGVYFEQRQDWSYRLVATTGHMLGLADIKLPDGSGDIPSANGNHRGIIIPRQAVITILKVARRRPSGAPMRLSVHQALTANDVASTAPENARTPIAIWQIGDVTLRTKLIDGTYPSYERVVPQNRTLVTFDRSDFRRAVDTVQKVCGTRSAAARIDFSAAGAKVSAANIDGSRASIEVDADEIPTDVHKQHVGVNAKLLAQVLDTLHGSAKISFGLNAEALVSSPIRILPVEAIGFGAILMPMRV